MKASQGYTFMEMVIVVMIMSIILTIAVPRFKELQANNRMASAANALAADLKRARGEAILRRSTLVFNQAVSDSSDPWGGGWRLQDANGTVITQNLALPSQVVITSTPAMVSVALTGIDGMVSQPGVGAVSMTFLVCDSVLTGEKGYTVSVSSMGRVAVKKNTAAGACA